MGDMSQFYGILLSGLGIIITALCTWVSTRVVAWLNSKISDKKAAGFATSLAKIVFDAVQSVFQTYVESLKKSGTFDEAAQKEALNKCLAIIKGQLTAELTEYIKSNFGDVEVYLTNQIEAVIYSLKK